MRLVLAVAGLLFAAPPLPCEDFNRYEPELLRSFSVGEGLSEFKVDPNETVTSGPSAIAFDELGNLYVCDALRGRLAVGDRAMEIRGEYFGTFSGYTLRLEVTQKGIGNHHFLPAFSWVDSSYRNKFLVWPPDGRYDPQPDSSLYYGDVVFAYLRDGTLVSVVSPGLDSAENDTRVLRHPDTRALLREPDKYGLAGLTVDDGGRLFVDGEIRTRSYPVFLRWCLERQDSVVARDGNAARTSYDPRRSQQTASYLGGDANGNTYWVDSLLVLVLDRAGRVIDLVKPTDRQSLQTVHPSGDLYRLPQTAEGINLERIRNVWDPKARELWEAQVIASTGEGIRSAEVTAGPLRVRRAAGPMGTVAGELAKGEAVDVLWHGSEKTQIDGFEDYWYEVRRKSDGLQGWVYGGYLRIQ